MEAIDHILAQHLNPQNPQELIPLVEAYRQGKLTLPLPAQQPLAPQTMSYQGMWALESSVTFLKEIERLCEKFAPPTPWTHPIQGELTQEQALAVQLCLQHPFACIVGGPGTGKTYTAGILIKNLCLQQPHARIALAAPTGKAAFHLKKSIDTHLTSAQVRASTLHSLLSKDQQLYDDIVLVDEASMIDHALMQKLLQAVKPQARCILMGDPNQLPPVDGGGLFTQFALGPHVARLTTCLRCDRMDILDCARDVLEGVWRYPLTPLSVGMWKQPREGTFLTPLKQGPFGVDRINEILFARALEKKQQDIPILITKNAPPLFNGQIGTLHLDLQDLQALEAGSRRLKTLKHSFAMFDGQRVSLPQLPSFDVSFALTVHKSQGSEFSHVHLLLPPGSEHFGPNMLYTAITRVQQSLTVYADPSTIEKILEHRV